MTSATHNDLTDIHKGDWVDRILPQVMRPYTRLARLDRPVGIWLTLFPCWAALFQAAHGLPDLRDLVVFTLGAFLMRSAGSTINDMADRNFDGHVERTRFRPLANGELSLFRALMFLAVQLALAAALLFFLAPFARLLAVGVLPLVVLYPFCKRFTHWPQAVLGAAFNWGMLVAWAQIAGHVPAGAVLMWAGAIAWQIGYDTTYGYVDVKDDRRLGLKSTAILFGAHGKPLIGLFYALTVLAWSAGGWLLGMSWPYAVGMVVIAAHLGWQALRFDIARPEINFRLFLANIFTGALLAVAAFAGAF
ncbi:MULTISPECIES: 4-hydroxybenzoate octaprenyltransferase [Hyphomicrobiales]|uniref:4-hydroxybenzoate octaprenyltransferase n=2 Tax=Hyphomicrobiales TaxID=356 RepID=A0A6L3Y7D8_9HYPH|nr:MULTISPECIES: 4-hydroxybenzoate octaprenyltransferase [Hyphomicrobiales]KAB2678430.1 4-hydroxybenzoate octaprenyltransferase [Brucella tritici]MBO0130451.1 4-hydroxybenzoate octaprenyltransferase [Agrobacterium burrii]